MGVENRPPQSSKQYEMSEKTKTALSSMAGVLVIVIIFVPIRPIESHSLGLTMLNILVGNVSSPIWWAVLLISAFPHFHEFGHCLAYLLQGISIEKIRLIPKCAKLQCCPWVFPKETRVTEKVPAIVRRKSLVTPLLLCLAAVIAMKLFSSLPWITAVAATVLVLILCLIDLFAFFSIINVPAREMVDTF